MPIQDLSNVDLSAADSTQESSVQEYKFGGVHGHNDLSHLSLYYKQPIKALIGRTGIVILSFFTIGLILSFVTLFLSYTTFGREFLQTLVFKIF
ncbi:MULTISPECIES: hypothetical protein [Pseudomonadati]|uniref:hypothetical protein n=1 Tax=unclassified Halobacteriovorax TaxID=2639665 RepID=UPI000CD1BBC4|nr:hypothetical protein [Halobacteriovorax sp. DA5]POB14253.1 hypothetical protein C0Z22_03970 [Halobacteriovorax sp. DA5]